MCNNSGEFHFFPLSSINVRLNYFLSIVLHAPEGLYVYSKKFIEIIKAP